MPETDTQPQNHGGAPAQERALRAQGKKTVKKLLDAGMEIFDRRSYHAARVDDIVELAKTSHGTFYLYFSNKDDLLDALIRNCADEFMQLADELPRITADEAGLGDLRDWLTKLTALYEVYGAVIRAWTEAESAEGHFGRAGAKVLGGFAGLVADCIRESNPDNKLDPGLAAVAVVAMVERLNYLAARGLAGSKKNEMVDTTARILHAGVFGG